MQDVLKKNVEADKIAQWINTHATKPDPLRSIPGIYMVEGESWLLLVVKKQT